jgi:hypothetical protein
MTHGKRDQTRFLYLCLRLGTGRNFEKRCLELLDDRGRRLRWDGHSAVNSFKEVNVKLSERRHVRKPRESLFRGQSQDKDLILVPGQVVRGAENRI